MMHWLLLITIIGARIDFEQVHFASKAACVEAENSYQTAPVLLSIGHQIPLNNLNGVFVATTCVNDGGSQ
jgi:hypothetical protein